MVLEDFFVLSFLCSCSSGQPKMKASLADERVEKAAKVWELLRKLSVVYSFIYNLLELRELFAVCNDK
jgi:hypothetical protein